MKTRRDTSWLSRTLAVATLAAASAVFAAETGSNATQGAAHEPPAAVDRTGATEAAGKPKTAPAPAVSTFNDKPIGAGPRSNGPADPAAPTEPTGLDLRRVFLSLVIVLGLIIALRVTAGRFVKRSVGARASTAIQVILRTTLSPRQQLVLIRVGRRLVLMTEGAGQNSVVCEIIDPDEVAGLVGQLQAETPSVPAGNPFGTFLNRFARRQGGQGDDGDEFEDDGSPVGGGRGDGLIDPSVSRTHRELDELAGKVQSVTRRFKLG